MQTKPSVLANSGEIVPRVFLNLTIAFDHDIVDGAPAARFTSRFLNLVQDGSLLLHEEKDGTHGSSSIEHEQELEPTGGDNGTAEEIK